MKGARNGKNIKQIQRCGGGCRAGCFFLELPGPETTFWYFQSLNLAVIQFGLFFSQMEIQERKESITVSAKNE